jgi:hypothetical protein
VEDGLLRVNGAQEPAPDKFVSLATIKFIGGLQTQRSAFASIDTRYNTKFLGGKPDALIAGLNVEISNKLTLQRRPGVIPYGVSNIPEPTNFFDWQLATTADIILVIDTETSGGDNNAGANGAVFNYSPTHSGIYFNKANLSKQANFLSVVDTMYVGDGADLYKVIGPNLLKYSNTFGSGSGTSFSIQSPWIEANVFALSGPVPATSTQPLQTGGAADPLGGTAATQLIWGTTGSGAYLEQDVVPNYTPIAKNTFTFSIWMREVGTPSVTDTDLQIRDQNGLVATTTVSLTQGWVKYQVTGTMNSNSTTVNVRLTNPTTTNPIAIWGAQLEVGGPATTTQLTLNLPQGVYLWGIQAPTSAPNISVSGSVVGEPWQPNHAYSTAIVALTSVANAAGGSTVYTGKVGHSTNFYAGYKLTIAGFLNTPNNGVFLCTASTTTTLTLANANGLLETDPGTATPTFSITGVVIGNGSAVYSGTILGGGGNAYAGYAFTIQGFSTPGNNGTFYCTASSGVSITLSNDNSDAANETINATALLLGQAITDSNGNLEVATSGGTSGSTAPTWAAGSGGQTQDGVQNVLIVQTASNPASSSGTVSTISLPANTTAGNSLLVFMVVNRNASNAAIATDTQGDTFTQVGGITSGPFSAYLAWAQNIIGGATTVTATCTGAGFVWVGAIECSPLNNLDGAATNQANSLTSGTNVFQTGLVSNSEIDDFFISFVNFIGTPNATSIASSPTGFSQILSVPGVNLSQGYAYGAVSFEFLTTLQKINPQWSGSFGGHSGGRALGITAAFNAASTTTLVWTNYGPVGLTAAIGFTYYYAFMNSETGHVSNVSPLSASTGVIAGQSVTITGAGMQTTPSGPYGQDPQVDTIALFRNTDGGGFWYQVATFPNPGTAAGPGTWSYTDVTPSDDLDTSISAPIGLLNSLPPTGLVDMEYFAGRMWGSVANFLYYNTAQDNAQILGVTQNGVPSESWIPSNYIPFNAAIVRIVAVGGGLIVCTTLDTWFVTGQNLLQGGFNPSKALAKHGLRSYNALDLDGSTIYMYTSDRESLMINPNSGSVEIGFPIGDTLEETFSPLSVCIARHVSGSQDNAVFMADGSTGWYRLNPNQVGASMSGEATPVWSPKADFTASIDGIGVIASIEVSAGEIDLLVGQTSVGPVLVRSLTTFTDNTVPYQWSATIGSIVMAMAGKLAEVDSITTEMNNSGGSSTASQCTVAVLLDEIAGSFETLPMGVNDPPGEIPSVSVLSNRFYLSQGGLCPVCRHIQIEMSGEEISGIPQSSKDELLALTVRGCMVSEQV